MEELDKISVEGFRGLSKLTLGGLSRVNVFGGANNSGKSTLLEAIMFMAGSCEGSILVRLNGLRNQYLMTWSDVSPVFYGNDFESTISVMGYGRENYCRSATARVLDRDVTSYVGERSADELMKKMLVVDTVITGKENVRDHFQSKFYYVRKSQNPQPGDIAEDGWLTMNASGRSPDGLMVSSNTRGDDYIGQLMKIIDGKRDQEILKVLQTIDDNIVRLVVNGKAVKVDVKGASNLLPIGMIGDGLRRILSLLVAAETCPEGGVLCIDEIDNGLHHTALQVMWSALLSAIRRRRIQAFVTTHNIEMLKVIGSEDSPGCQSDVRYFNLVRRKNNEVMAFGYSKAELASSLEGDLEVR